MSYIDARIGSRTKPIVAVAAVHAVIAYAFISGLAMQVIPFIETHTVATSIPDQEPPPRSDPIPPKAESQRTVDVITVPMQIDRPDLDEKVIEMPFDRTSTFTGGEAREEVVPSPRQTEPATNLARASRPLGSRAAWVTTDDYPPAAQREGSQGIVGIALAIGVEGRVTACEVTASSGNAQLDAATCRVYARRARFSPALDEQGHAIASRTVDRVRWQLPAD